MSRSQKNVRMGISGPGPVASQNGSTAGVPAEVTKQDGAQNIAGTVNRFSTDDYGPETMVIQDQYPRG